MCLARDNHRLLKPPQAGQTWAALEAGRLGFIIVQFPLNDRPCKVTHERLMRIREHLPSPTYKVAVEFRDRMEHWLLEEDGMYPKRPRMPPGVTN